MISEKEIACNCIGRTYERAQRIAAAADRNILTKRVRYEMDETALSALVASSSGWDDRYRTSVSLDADEERIVDWSCTCPAAFEYDGMCKHCAALALAFRAEPEKFLGFQKKRKVATSPALLDLMHRNDQEQADAELAGSIDLEATLSYGFRLWSASFRVVGPAGAYVVKSVSDFVRRMRQGERFAYGKKLAFTHTPALLTERACAIAEMLDRAVSLRERTGAGARWGYASGVSIGRDIDLSPSETIELLDALEGSEFAVRGTDIGTRTVTRAHVVREDPDLGLRLEEAPTRGYFVKHDRAAVLAHQGERLYVWMGDTFYRCSRTFARCGDFLRTVYDGVDAAPYLAREDMPLFCSAVLPRIERALNISVPESVRAFRPVKCSLRFYFDKTRAGVSCEAVAAYGEALRVLASADASAGKGQGGSGAVGGPGGSVVAGGPGEPESMPDAPLRDRRAEARACELVERYFGLGRALIPSSDEDATGALLFTGLAQFKALGEVFTTPAFDRLIRDGKPRVTLGVSFAGNLVNLTVRSDDLAAEELAALLASYHKRKRYHRLRSGAYVSIADLDLSQLDRLSEDLGISAKALASGSVELPSFRAFYLDEEEDLERDRSFTRYLDNFRAADERSYVVPPKLEGVLRPYQAEGFRWLSARCDAGFGGILADEMGLGKSVQLIALLLARRDEARSVGPSLIVCPASLVYNWLAEFERFAPDMDVRVVAGSKRERALARQAAFGAASDGAFPEGACDVLITSYDLLRIDVAEWAGRALFCCALDEAQYIKNPAALVTRAVKRIDAEHRFALTGTPMENRLSELWSIFDFLMPGLLGQYTRFRERFELPIVGGEEGVARRLQAVVGPFLLRRLKTQVLADLPDKLESAVYVPLEGEQQRLYAAFEQRLREELTRQKNDKRGKMGRASGMSEEEFNKSKVQILAELTRLRQLCCDPRLLLEDYHGPAVKLDTIAELIDAAKDGGEKVLVFSQFTSFLSLIAERLEKQGTAFYTITGATPKQERVRLVRAFNADDVPVFLVSLKAGGTGLNLTGASVVIHADPWWNAAAQNQATDRAHRIGQTRVVSVQKVIARNTIEERILKLQEAKADLADQVVGASGVSLANMTREDLLDLLNG